MVWDISEICGKRINQTKKKKPFTVNKLNGLEIPRYYRPIFGLMASDEENLVGKLHIYCCQTEKIRLPYKTTEKIIFLGKFLVANLQWMTWK